MDREPSGDYYDYTQTMQPEQPWLVQWHQRFVYRIIHARRGGFGKQTGDPQMTADRPPEHRHVYGDGKIATLYLTYEDSLEVIRRVSNLTAGIPQMVLLTGWQYEGHDSKYPAWGQASPYLKRDGDESALQSLRWLFREARKYNCLTALHVNMFDAYPDSPLFEQYVEKDIIAKDKNGKPIIGNRWWGIDCYHISYTQEWKHGLAQKRIDDLLEMIPEIRENACIYVDAFLGARKAEQKGPISPYLGYSKEEEARTQRKILRYWRNHGVDPACEHVWGMRVDRFVGLQPYSAAQMKLIEEFDDALYTSSPYHAGFEDVRPPEDFHLRFCLEVVPYYYKNNPAGGKDFTGMLDGTDLCMPALWCEKPTLIAYSKAGYADRTWQLPADWKDVKQVDLAQLNIEAPQPVGSAPVTDGKLTLSVEPDQSLVITESQEA